MVQLFITIMNRSITASFAAIAVMLIRLCLKKTPRIFSYLLWIVVLVRFLIPISLESGFGIIPAVSVSQAEETDTRKETVPHFLSGEREAAQNKRVLPNNTLTDNEPVYLPADQVTEQTEYVYEIKGEKPTEVRIAGKSFEIAPGMMRILASLWLLTALLLLLYEAVSYGSFMKKLSRENGSVTKEKEGHRNINIRVLEGVKEPFITGLFCPAVYLPANLEEGQRELILEHEKVHIRRLDYLIKPTALLICCVYWFNPFAWLSFYLMEHDMESSCDEAVMRKIGYDRKKEYATTLLCLAERKVWKPGQRIAFGENNVVSRIKNAVRLKKAAAWIVAAGAFAAVGSVALLLVNRPEESGGDPAGEVQTLVSETVIPSEAAEDAGAHSDEQILYSYPVEYSRISNDFGTRIHPFTQEEEFHSGIDFAAVQGTPITAAADGNVAETGYDEDCGNYIILRHGNGDMTYYACCETILSEEGNDVKRGEQIAAVGSTGKSTGYHLHFAVSRGESFIRPEFEEEGGKEGADEKIAAAAEETVEEGELTENSKSSISEVIDKYGEYGLSVQFSENDFQLYYNGEPICFFADNQNGDHRDEFKGTVISKEAGDKNGYTGVITRRDEEGKVTGLVHLSREEAEAYKDGN